MNKVSFFLILGLISTNSFAQTFNWLIDRELMHQVRAANWFKQEIESKTNKKIRINIKTIDCDLKTAPCDFEGHLRNNTYQISQVIIQKLRRNLPQFQIWDIPFLFQNPKHLESYVTSDLGQSVLNETTDNKMLAINYSFAGGFLNMYTTMKLKSFANIKNEKCEFQADKNFVNHYMKKYKLNKLLKDNYLDSACGEILASEVDFLYQRKDFEKIWLNITGHRALARISFVNIESLKSLSKNHQGMFTELLKKALDQERLWVYQATELVERLVENRGLQINRWTDKKKYNYIKNHKNQLKILSDKAKAHVHFINEIRPQEKRSEVANGRP